MQVWVKSLHQQREVGRRSFGNLHNFLDNCLEFYKLKKFHLESALVCQRKSVQLWKWLTQYILLMQNNPTWWLLENFSDYDTGKKLFIASPLFGIEHHFFQNSDVRDCFSQKSLFQVKSVDVGWVKEGRSNSCPISSQRIACPTTDSVEVFVLWAFSNNL